MKKTNGLKKYISSGNFKYFCKYKTKKVYSLSFGKNVKYSKLFFIYLVNFS